MEQLQRTAAHPLRPEKILQIGEGNFLRCFIDWQVDILNEKCGLDAGIVVARPIDSEFPPSLNTQGGVFTTILRGYDENDTLRDEKRLITSVNREIAIYREYDQFLGLAANPDLRFIVSNTTEAGIAINAGDRFDDRPPGEYPAKLTRFLYERYTVFNGAENKGFILLPCELLDYNGDELKKCVLKYIDLWQLGDGFRHWVEQANTFCSTLVDRIVTGYPKDDAEKIEEELGYRDAFLVTGEYFHLFVIQAPKHVAEELRLAGADLNIEVVDDLGPYKNRKVGILNGCHTALVPIAYLCNIDLVKDAVSEPILARFIEKLLDEEIIPNLGMPEDYLKEYAASVVGRFKNPFIQHRLLDISLNSMSKFKTRLLPQFLKYYEKNGEVPPLMSLSLAALICFYRGERDGGEYPLKDDKKFLDLFAELWGAGRPMETRRAETIAETVLGLADHWGVDLSELDGLVEKTAADILAISGQGMRQTLAGYL